MSTTTTAAGGDEGDVHVRDFVQLSMKCEDQNVGDEEKHGDFWGDISKYTDEDFDPSVLRLNVPRSVEFVKLRTSKFENPMGTFVIQNSSNMPMTYNIVPISSDTEEITASPGQGWIPPHSMAQVEILIGKNAAKSLSTIAIRHSKAFAVYGAPVFREEHTQQKKLELFWKGFGTNMFPYNNAEAHTLILHVSSVEFEDFDPYTMTPSIRQYLGLGSPQWLNLKQTSDEEFESLWTKGDDPDEYKFCLEFRLKEHQCALKRGEMPHGEIPREKRLSPMSTIGVIIAMFAVVIAVCILITLGA